MMLVLVLSTTSVGFFQICQLGKRSFHFLLAADLLQMLGGSLKFEGFEQILTNFSKIKSSKSDY